MGGLLKAHHTAATTNKNLSDEGVNFYLCEPLCVKWHLKASRSMRGKDTGQRLIQTMPMASRSQRDGCLGRIISLARSCSLWPFPLKRKNPKTGVIPDILPGTFNISAVDFPYPKYLYATTTSRWVCWISTLVDAHSIQGQLCRNSWEVQDFISCREFSASCIVRKEKGSLTLPK